MAPHRSFHPVLRTLALLALIVLPALAVTTVDATAHTRSSKPAARGGSDDLDATRLTWDRERISQLIAAHEASSPPSRAAIARASRSLVRAVLTNDVYVRPVPGPVTQWYGSHPGIDIAPAFGTPIGAAHSGVVTFVGWEDGYGMHVEVAQADGYVTTYSHMSAFSVKVGQLVLAGQMLGQVGSTGWSTGPHLHFEVHVPGGARMDPAVWLRDHHVKL